MAILKDIYTDFDFKGMTTPEIAEWTRSELRSAFDEFNAISNVRLTKLIIDGVAKIDVTT